MMSLSILEGTAMFPKPIVDQRYQVLTCESCKRKILLFRDSSNGNANIGGSFALICPQCGGKASLDAQRSQHYQKRTPHSLR